MVKHCVYSYIHGFLSGPNSYKGGQLAGMFRQRGKFLHLPNCNHATDAPMAVSEAIPYLHTFLEERRARGIPAERAGAAPTSSSTDDEVAATCQRNVKHRLIGSSYGGYLAARYAQLFPEEVDSIILLSPVFHVVQVFERAEPVAQ